MNHSHRLSPTRLLMTAIGILVFATMAYFMILGNDVDWDQFFSSAAVDWIGWMTEERPPLWSYPFCGGVTRIGDPQAFGVSPLFVLVLLFGPIWGTKAIQLLLFCAGYFFTRKISLCFLEGSRDPMISLPQRRVVASSIALMLVSGGYMLWRSVIGHYTAFPMYLILGLIYFNLRALSGPLTTAQWVGAILVGWLYYTTGFYFSLTFLWLPFALALALAFSVSMLSRMALRRPLTDLGALAWRVIALNVAALLPGLYKVVPVILHHLHYPRGGASAWDNQSKLVNFLLFQFIPTRGAQLVVGQRFADYYYQIFEMGGFSPISWIFIIALLLAISASARNHVRSWRSASAFSMRRFRRDSVPVIDVLPSLLIIYSVLSVLLLLGNFATWAPLPLINRFLFRDSVIVSERFHFSVTLSWTLLLVWLIARHGLPRTLRALLWAGLAVSYWNLLGFAQQYTPLSTMERLRGFLEATPSNAPSTMKFSIIGKPVGFIPMYATLVGGKGFLNCYNHMNRPMAMAKTIEETEKRLWDGTPPFTSVDLPLVGDGGTLPPRSCVEGSYFTSSRIHLDPSCPPGVCLNINAVNPRDPLSRRLQQVDGLYCLRG